MTVLGNFSIHQRQASKRSVKGNNGTERATKLIYHIFSHIAVADPGIFERGRGSASPKTRVANQFSSRTARNGKKLSKKGRQD